MEGIREFSSVLQVLGLPTIFALSCWCAKKCVQFSKNLNILQSAQKAQMRSQLLNNTITSKSAHSFMQTN